MELLVVAEAEVEERDDTTKSRNKMEESVRGWNKCDMRKSRRKTRKKVRGNEEGRQEKREEGDCGF